MLIPMSASMCVLQLTADCCSSFQLTLNFQPLKLRRLFDDDDDKMQQLADDVDLHWLVVIMKSFRR